MKHLGERVSDKKLSALIPICYCANVSLSFSFSFSKVNFFQGIDMKICGRSSFSQPFQNFIGGFCLLFYLLKIICPVSST